MFLPGRRSLGMWNYDIFEYDLNIVQHGSRKMKIEKDDFTLIEAKPLTMPMHQT